VGQALPKGKPVHLVIDRHPLTGNPMMLEIRNQRAETHHEIPVKCQPWLSAGTIVVGTLVHQKKNTWYVLNDVYQIGGRWLWGASHRERLGALVGIMNAIDCSGAGLLGWPRFATATMLPESDGVRPPEVPSENTLGYAVRQVQHKVLCQTDTIFLVGQDVVPEIQKRAPWILGNGMSKGGSPASSSRIVSDVAKQPKPYLQQQPKQQPEPVKNNTNKLTGNEKTKKGKFETVIITAGVGGPDDYVAADMTGKRIGRVSVRSLNLSLKLNQLLRGNHYDLYRPPGPMRILPNVSLSCCWESKHQCWRPELDFSGTKTNVT
jgi:hypothetical protein